ncbi:unknown protein [Desulfotalea psychrophila LSv54]|uniref:Uncharacterized protein n=1 Tax=Desulfotalea psychrophila (strain LSv54 / DSM 12343) TaxID=177439 RepID=Q6ARI3_DESPS|nr:unknown protein [Desulfotalea psychrophila LSv54]
METSPAHKSGSATHSIFQETMIVFYEERGRSPSDSCNQSAEDQPIRHGKIFNTPLPCPSRTFTTVPVH